MFALGLLTSSTVATTTTIKMRHAPWAPQNPFMLLLLFHFEYAILFFYCLFLLLLQQNVVALHFAHISPAGKTATTPTIIAEQQAFRV